MPTESSIHTPLSEGVTREAVIAVLHDHESYIKITCPQLIDYKKLSGTPGMDSKCEYEVTDKRPIGQTTYMLSLTNSKEGILAVVDGKAPTGSIHIESVWTVYDDKITEEVTIDANMVMKKMIKGSVEKNHPGQHQGFVLAAKS